MKIIKRLACFLLLSVLFVSGCDYNYRHLFTGEKKNEAPLIKAEIHFSENDKVTGYIRDLGVEDVGKVYVGGASLNYIYDQDGNIVGSYNYQRVEYIKILTE